MRNGISAIVLIGIFLLFMYFTAIRPQKKQTEQRKQLMNSLAYGDKILTYGGLIGLLESVGEETAIIVLSPDDVRIELKKESIYKVLEKGSDVSFQEEKALQEAESEETEDDKETAEE